MAEVVSEKHRPDPRDNGKPCRVCGRTIRYVRARRAARGYFQHVFTDGLRWSAEARAKSRAVGS